MIKLNNIEKKDKPKNMRKTYYLPRRVVNEFERIRKKYNYKSYGELFAEIVKKLKEL